MKHGVVAYRLWVKASCGWLGCDMSAGYTTGPVDSGWLYNVPLYHQLMPISCHFRDSKALLGISLMHVNSTVPCAQTFHLSFTGPFFRVTQVKCSYSKVNSWELYEKRLHMPHVSLSPRHHQVHTLYYYYYYLLV